MKENENGNEIECISRRYRVRSPGGMVVDIESSKPLSGQLNDKLLAEDSEIGSFFSNHKVMNIRQVVTMPTKNPQERKIESKLSPKNGIFTPRQRFNNLLKMKGEFNRKDYQKYMSDVYGVAINKYMAWDDIRSAIVAKRLEIIEGKVGRARTYRVVDPTDVDDTLYKTLINDRKLKVGIMN